MRRVGLGCGVGALLLGALGSSAVVSPAGRAPRPEELTGRGFEATYLAIDGRTRDVTDHWLGFDRFEERYGISIGEQCGAAADGYRIAEGRLVLDRETSLSTADHSMLGLGMCEGAREDHFDRLVEFYSARPYVSLSGGTLRLRGSGVEIDLVDTAGS